MNILIVHSFNKNNNKIIIVFLFYFIPTSIFNYSLYFLYQFLIFF